MDALQLVGLIFIFITMSLLFYLAQKVYHQYRRNKSKATLAFCLTFISWGSALLFLGLERIFLLLYSIDNTNSLYNLMGISSAILALIFSIGAVLILDLFASIIAFPKHLKKLIIVPIVLALIFLIGLLITDNVQVDAYFEITFPHYVRTSMLFTIFPIFLFPLMVLAYYIYLMKSKSSPHATRAAWVALAIFLVILTYVCEVIGPPETINYLRSLYVLAAIIFYISFTRFIELQWPEKIHRLYFCISDGICLYDHSFKQDKSSDISSSLVTGFITGVISLVQEITQTKKYLKVIDVEDIKILLEYGQHNLIAILVSEESYKIIRNKLKKTVQEFEIRFATELSAFKGIINEFQNAKEIVNKIFSYEEKF